MLHAGYEINCWRHLRSSFFVIRMFPVWATFFPSSSLLWFVYLWKTRVGIFLFYLLRDGILYHFRLHISNQLISLYLTGEKNNWMSLGLNPVQWHFKHCTHPLCNNLMACTSHFFNNLACIKLTHDSFFACFSCAPTKELVHLLLLAISTSHY